MTAALAWWRREVVEHRGSTRAVGLLRVLLALICWSRFAEELAYFHDCSWYGWAVATAFYTVTGLMFVGWHARLATAATGALGLWMVFGDGREPWIHHHIWALFSNVCLLALTPCGESFSVDRWRANRAAFAANRAPTPEVGDLWATRLIALQVTAIYAYAVVDKLSPAFLSGERLQMIGLYFYGGSVAPSWPLWPLGTQAAAWAVVVVEAILAVGLWVPRLRAPTIALGLALHAVIYTTLPVATFTVTMWALYLAFLDPGAVHRATDTLLGHRPEP